MPKAAKESAASGGRMFSFKHMHKAGSRRRSLWLTAVYIGLFAIYPASVFSQSFGGDARKIGMSGSIDDGENLTSDMMNETSYRSIGMPFGLIQLYKDRNSFDPGKDTFDPVRLLEDATNPLHLSLTRDNGGGAFIHDLVNAQFNRDLNSYRGFVPAKNIKAQGLASPSFGHTFKVPTGNGTYQGVYVGAGPYLAIGTDFNFDDQLRTIFASSQDVVMPNTTFAITDRSAGQLAMAVTMGYRARIGLSGLSGSNKLQGLYLATNYHILHGYRYDDANMRFTFDTDSAGLVTLTPTSTPVNVDHTYSTSGNGRAVDIGAGLVVDRWRFGFSANGIGNQIRWQDVKMENFTLGDVLNGMDFTKTAMTPASSELVAKLPIRYVGDVGYTFGQWSVVGEGSQGFQGFKFHGGVERKVSFIDLRGGLRYAQDLWHPTGGVGLNLSHKLSVDVAAFSNGSNIEHLRKISFATSLRINHNQ